ncbi:MAG: hypothetical protein B7O98_00050 [Zestosphaera tikiterensis]|uniref:Uncharacterized protein n=1 Tax=Zestosphaera tikiterensis TaxID=1973259 RepID=A0A2R7Y8G9_9CREN|nr:MAG: hypothetical protein B7O98_00050 [Zestosphaera tikiterensis]
MLGVPYISWVVLSPYIEATFLEGVEGGDVRAVLTCLYYVALYAVSLKLSVVLIAYSLTFFFVRFYVVKLRSWSYGWVDSLLRLALWGAVSQWTPA